MLCIAWTTGKHKYCFWFIWRVNVSITKDNFGTLLRMRGLLEIKFVRHIAGGEKTYGVTK